MPSLSHVDVALPPPSDRPARAVSMEFVNEMGRAGSRIVTIPSGARGRTLDAIQTIAPVRSRRSQPRSIVVPMMGPDIRFLKRASSTGKPVPFAWDVWERDFSLWVDMIRSLKITTFVCTSSMSARVLGGMLPDVVVASVPEATRTSRFSPAPAALVDRDIHVLELGRKFETWHSTVADTLRVNGFRHLYESSPGAMVFPTGDEMLDGLARSAISVCFPSSTTHPGRSGNVTTMTHRYLESIASGCLIVGGSVPELTELFGFDPVVPASMNSAIGQLLEILENLGSFQEHVDNARRRVLEVGDWSHRVSQLAPLL